jgi:hypothetical protein
MAVFDVNDPKAELPASTSNSRGTAEDFIDLAAKIEEAVASKDKPKDGVNWGAH